MIEIKTQMHTIIMLIGPSGSGKSTFAKEIIIPQLSKPFDKTKNFKPNIQYISSDEIRRDLIGMDADKFDNVMTESSELAFKLLFTKLDMVTTYPINAEFVILDTTGLSEDFRNQVLEIAEKNNYNVDAIIFDYKKVDDYKKNFTDDKFKGKETGGKIIAGHMKRLRTEVMKTMQRGKYNRITKIKSKDFLKEEFDLVSHNSTTGVGAYDVWLEPTVKIFAWDYEKYVDRILPRKYDWVTIGDVHGCIDELKELITKYGFEIDGDIIKDTPKSENIGLILAGDIVDKSTEDKIEETLRFVHKNMKLMGDRLQLIMGNHEEMVWKWVTNHPSLEKTEKRLHEKEVYYNTSGLLEKNDELKQIFLEIFDNMKGWVKTIGTTNRSFIVTHAPCPINVLEKMDGKSLRKQYKCLSRSKNPDKTNDEITPYLKEEAVNNQPVHIFGHMGQSSVRTFKNKVCIDTGCVYGHKLVGYSVNGARPFIQSVSAIGEKKGRNDFGNELFAEVAKERGTVRIDDLSETNQKRLDYIIENGISYIGGTISPADKDEETGKLESLKAGLDYYKGKVDEVVLQPKYMGSRAQMYLNRDIEKCYATSRNGYKIRQDIGNVLEDELKRHTSFMDKHNLSEIILDGELMPWAAIGAGLIEKQFVTIDKALESEISFLEENGFDTTFEELIDSYYKSGFTDDMGKLSKKEMSDKYGHAYNNFKDLKWEIERYQPIEKHKEAWKVYHEQVEIYGAEGEIHFKPFRLLKAIDTIGNVVEVDMTNSEQFAEFNNDEIYVYNFSDGDLDSVEDWYNRITQDEKMEGCVIKPNTKEVPEWVAPFMKVRNPNYLTIIYGYDMYFPKKFEKLFRQKNINKKVKASIQEYKLGEQMLKSDVNSDGFKQIVANFMFENEKENGIDPRL